LSFLLKRGYEKESHQSNSWECTFFEKLALLIHYFFFLIINTEAIVGNGNPGTIIQFVKKYIPLTTSVGNQVQEICNIVQGYMYISAG
jgi:hypothetical protein